MRNRPGFTLIELVIVIAIIGILASLSVPKFIDMSTQAKIAKAKAGLGALRAALATRYASSATGGFSASYPTYLDATDFANGEIPHNPISFLEVQGIRVYNEAPTAFTSWQCMGGPDKGYWFVTDPLAGTPPGSDYGKAGACTADNTIIDTSGW